MKAKKTMSLRNILLIISIAIFIPSLVHAKHVHPERFYQEKWCYQNKGYIEFILLCRTRVDCLTKSHAIEFDFASKWTEAIGQSLYYSLKTGKKAGIVLIIEKQSDFKYWLRLNSVIEKLNLKIDTWKIELEYHEKQY